MSFASARGLAATSTAHQAFRAAPPTLCEPSSPPQLRDPSSPAQLPFAAGVPALVAAVSLSRKSRARFNHAAKASRRAVVVGAEVIYNGMEGTVRYVGSTNFAPGEWVGVELKAGGMHNGTGMYDGTVMGVSYFECPESSGVWALPEHLLGDKPTVRKPGRPVYSQPDPVGTSVSVNGKQGTVRYKGRTKFAVGEWVGVELAEGEGGMHDGTVMGTKYFECPAGCGIFVPPCGIVLIPAPEDCIDCLGNPDNLINGDRIFVGGDKVGTVRYVGETKFRRGTYVGVELDSDDDEAGDGSMDGVSYFSCPPRRGVFIWQLPFY